LVKVLFRISITYFILQNIILLSLCLYYRVSCELMESIERKRLLISGGAGAGNRAGGSTVTKLCCVSISFHIYIHTYILHKICLLHIFTMSIRILFTLASSCSASPYCPTTFFFLLSTICFL